MSFSRTTWSNYELGKSEPSIKGLIDISNFFGITLDQLLAKDLSKTSGSESLELQAHTHELHTANEPEPDLSFIMRELKKLRREMNTIKDTGPKK